MEGNDAIACPDRNSSDVWIISVVSTLGCALLDNPNKGNGGSMPTHDRNAYPRTINVGSGLSQRRTWRNRVSEIETAQKLV